MFGGGIPNSINQMPGVNSINNPGGNPQEQQDPLRESIEVVSAALDRLAQEAEQYGILDGARFANQLRMYANKINKEKMDRERQIRMASTQGLKPILSQQL